MPTYNHRDIEKRARALWQKENLYQTDLVQAENKFYCLDMFPYPSGDGLHVGHWRGYVLSDYFARYQRLHGKNVLHPMGFDAFGLPAENAAIKNKSHPKKFIDSAIKQFTSQLDAIGAAYDWSKTVNTSDPNYYHWTQWLFLQFFKHGLAEKRLSWVNWCPKDKTVLANEQVINGCCERCGSKVTKKQLSQWYLKITDFAEELLNGLEALEWPEHVKTLQRNWIGQSEGAAVNFHTDQGQVEIFTTRPDTLFGVTALVLAPEHPLVEQLTKPEHKNAVEKYRQEAQNKTDLDRQKNEAKAKTGVFTGSAAMHPLTHKEIPVWVADYVLPSYGFGAVMLVPAHDQRDFAFAKAHNLPITRVIGSKELPYEGEGELVNSNSYNGLTSNEAQSKITRDLAQKSLGKAKTTFRLRDWLVSRQRYWGAPIPIVYDPEGNPHPVKDEHLPLELPTDVDFQPGGESPVKRSKAYQKQAEKLYGKGWRFETDTLDTFVDSSWYYLRFLSSNDPKQAFDKKLAEAWLPVDLYIGGIEHAILHLLYARFVYRFLVKFDYLNPKTAEPFSRLYNIGMITLKGAKMSKSKGNVVSPDELVAHYGTDALRGFELFLGPMDASLDWQSRGINGVHRFLIKVHQLQERLDGTENSSQRAEFDNYLSAIEPMIADFRLNTVLSAAMVLANKLSIAGSVDQEVFKRFVTTLSPAFPFIAEEIWANLGQKGSIFGSQWPKPFGQVKSTQSVVILLDQRYVGEITASEPLSEEQVLKLARQDPSMAVKLQNISPLRTIYKPQELLNIITK